MGISCTEVAKQAVWYLNGVVLNLLIQILTNLTAVFVASLYDALRNKDWLEEDEGIYSWLWKISLEFLDLSQQLKKDVSVENSRAAENSILGGKRVAYTIRKLPV